MPEEVGAVYQVDISQAFAALDKLAAQDAQLRAAVLQTGQAQQRSFTEAAQAALAYQARVSAAAAEVRNSVAVHAELRREIGKTAAEEKELERAFRAAGGAATANGARISAELSANRNKQKELRVEIELTRQAIDAERAAVLKVKEAQQQQVGQQKLATAAARDSARAQQQVAASAKEAATGSGSLLDGLIGKGITAAAGLFGISKLFGAIKQGITDFSQLDSVEKTFKALTGSASAGAQEVAFLRAESNRLGLDLVPTARAYTGLFAAAKEANIPIATTRDLFSSLTTAGRVLGKSQAEVESALRAVEQMMSKGTVQSQELKLQLGNALPGAFSLAAKAAGVTTKELGKMLERGQIVASEFLPKFAAELKRAYGGGSADAAAATAANMGRIETAYKSASAKIGAFFAPTVALIAQFVSAQETAAQKSERLVGEYQKQGSALKELQTTVTPLLSRYEQLSSQTTRNAGEQQELKRVIEELGLAVPSAVTEFDAYGKALGVNGKAVRQFIEDQQNLTRYNNRTRIEENGQALRQLLQEQEDYQRKVALLNTTERETGRRVLPKGATRGGQILYYTPEETSQIIADAGVQLNRISDDIRANLQNRQILRGKSPLLPTGDDAANDAAAQGLIDKQKKLIDSLQERQSKAAKENKNNGADFLFGADGLNKQLEVAQAELDRLLGKVDKDRKERQKKGPDYLKQLLAEEERLRKEAGKQELALIKDSGEARAAEQFRQALEEIKRTEEKLKKLERLAGRDGKIDGVQAQELATLRAQASQAYFEELERIALAYNDRLFALRADSDEKELTAIERKYDREARAARGQTALLLDIEDARQRELIAARQRQGQQQIERRAELQTSAALRVGESFGQGTGRSVIEAKRAEKEALLRIDLEKNEALLNNSLLLAGDQAEVVRAALAAQIAELKNGIRQVEAEKGRMDPQGAVYRLILGENDSDENRAQLDQAVGSSLGALSELIAADAAAQQAKIDARSRTIDELNTRLSQEIQLNKEGSASNIGNLKEQIAQEKAARREAVAERKKAAKEQIIIDTLLQSSNVITAASQALSAFPVPFVGPALGIAAASLIVGAFVASKVKAFQAVNKQSEGFFKGGYTGDGDMHGQSQAVGPRPYVYHNREFVMNNELTRDYRQPLLEPLHRGRPQDIDWSSPQMRRLLPDFDLPNRLREGRAAVIEHRHQVAYQPLQAGLDSMRAELAEMKGHTARLPTKQFVNNPDGSLLEIDLLTGNQTTYRKL
ncbi:tape measure protein [Hymenobacter lapidiphilus]|uniref:Tape measure protein n=1 Tax=Hymenobacter lapidiphilus TaxID=2608003 RepID=A0A7Y7U7A2_9BACT|nr:tape measure protein [Hymenobacter lapidiphilus]NVO33207.1 tape measure protein [Hymenobacter lapidiphilus]